MNRRVIVVGAAIIAIGAATATALFLHGQAQNRHSSESFASQPPLIDSATLAAYPKKSASSANLAHVSSSLIPPTNSWISGAVLQATPDAIYPMPLSFLAKDTGFEIGLPAVQSSSTTITGPHLPGITASITSATGFSLTRFDKISATLTYRTDNSTLGSLTLAEGSPFVYYRATIASTVNVTGLGDNLGTPSPTYLRYQKGAHAYAIAAYDNATIARNGNDATITLPSGGLVTFYALPDASGDALHEYAGNELTRVDTVSSLEDTRALTTFTYHTVHDKPTVFVPMSYSDTHTNTQRVQQYESIYGQMNAVTGHEFTLSTPRISPDDTLDLTYVSSEEKKHIIESLQADIAATSIVAKDSYFAGKGLARAANLLMLAESLGETDKSKQLIAILKNALTSRLATDYFYYDSSLHGMAATSAAFGSEDFNDHHFHYGYFLYAASILARYNSSFLTEHGKQVNLLAADIASYASSTDFPLQRYYDPYAQHSWAAGLAPFADGNNQESSSEAVNAWNAVALWGNVTKNSALEESAIWMLSNESATATRAWRVPNATLNASYLKSYTKPVSSLNFGGKRTYGTFFSDEPSAKLGIQLIPMTPVMRQFKDDGRMIASTIEGSISHDNYNVPLGDYILMYLALSDPAKAKGLIGSQSMIDDGNSKSYMEAWIFSQK